MRTKHTKLLEWLKTASDADVEKTGTSRGYLKQIAYGNKQASAMLASSLERVSNGLLIRAAGGAPARGVCPWRKQGAVGGDHPWRAPGGRHGPP